METRASYLLVGVFALLAMAGFVIAVVWMAGANLREDLAHYDIYFDGSVTGLKPGNTVRYRGIPVGAVTDIAINPKNVQQVRVVIEVPGDTPIKTDTIAALETQGLTGVAFIQLTGGTNEAPKLKAGRSQERPVIQSRPSQLEELVQGAPELMARVTALVNKGNILLGGKNLQNIEATLQNVQSFTGTLSEESPKLVATIRDTAKTIRNAMNSLDSAMRQHTAETKGIGGEFNQTLGDIRKTSVEFRRAAFDLADMLETNKEPFNTFASSGLYELTQLLSEMRILVAALSRITAKVESDPGRFLYGKSQPGVEVK